MYPVFITALTLVEDNQVICNLADLTICFLFLPLVQLIQLFITEL